jgi:hypothetical protein
MQRTLSAAIGGLAWLTISCGAAGHSEPDRPAPAAQASSGAEQATAAAKPPPDLGYHMRASFWAAVQARDALIDGDLAKAQRAADVLVNYDYDALLPHDWRHWYAQLQQYAKELSMAPNLAAAAQELGHVALICGDCHDLHERGPAAPRAAPLPWEDPPEQLEARMHRHQLGVAQLWDGLVLPSERAWRSGTVTITRAPLRAPEADDAPIDEAMHQRIEAVRALAKEARTVTSYDERGRVYGELIAGCAECHALLRPARQQ